MDTARPPTPVDAILLRMSQKLFIMRDKAARELARMRTELTAEDVRTAENWITRSADAPIPETRQGAVMAAMRNVEFKSTLIKIALRLLKDDEPPVRVSVADLLPLLVEGDVELFNRFIAEIVSTLPVTPGAKATEREGSLLDTLFRALHMLLTSHKPPQPLPADAWTAIQASSTHAFPFVRQAALPLIAWVCSTTPVDATAHSAIIAHALCTTLLDISPRVRFAAVAAVRPFIDACCRHKPLDEQFPQLIPPLCLNRYFPAEGLGRVCADTWQHAVDMRGRAVIGRLMSSVLECYLSEAKAALPACREAACRCLSELVAKIEPGVVAPHADKVIGGLVQLASDPSWQIRDAALTGLANALQHFRAHADASALDALLRVRIADFIWCVREAAAGAFMVLHTPDTSEGLAQTVALIRTGLEGYSAQQEESDAGHKGHEHAHKPGEPHPHTDEPWQLTAGALSLWHLLALRSPAQGAVFVPLVVQVAVRRVHFCQRAQLLETLWSELGAVAPVLSDALAPHWSTLVPLMVQDAGASQAVRRAVSKTAVVLKKHIPSATVAALPAEVRAGFDELAGTE